MLTCKGQGGRIGHLRLGEAEVRENGMGIPVAEELAHELECAHEPARLTQGKLTEGLRQRPWGPHIHRHLVSAHKLPQASRP